MKKLITSMKKNLIISGLLLFSLLNSGSILARTVTYSGAGTTWITTAGTNVTVTNTASTSSKSWTGCYVASSVATPSLNASAAAIKTNLDLSAERIDSVLIIWMNNANPQTITYCWSETDIVFTSSVATLTNGGLNVSNSIASAAGTINCPGQMLKFPSGSKVKSFLIERQSSYNPTTTSLNTNYASVSFKQGGTSSPYTTSIGTGSSAYLGQMILYISSLSPNISSFTAAGVSATINETAKTITAVLPYGTNLTSITPTVGIGGTATSYSPPGAQDFSNSATTPLIYTVTDGTNPVNYAVTLTASQVANTDATLSDLKVDGTTVTGFSAATLTYDVTLPYTYSGLPVISSTVNAATSNQVISQVSAIPGFATVLVTAQDNSQKTYTVNFTRTPISTACDITSFSINGKIGVIDPIANTILVQMHLTTDVTNLTPIVVVSSLANYSPTGAQNFTNPVLYTVTAQDGTQKTYTVTVQLVDLSYTGTYPYITNFPSGYVIPSWMGSPTGGIIFTDPYIGNDKGLWYDNATETSNATASVIRFNTTTSMELLVSQCGTVIAKVSATGSRTYNLYINGTLANTVTVGTANVMATLTASPNLSTLTTIRIENPSTSGGITLGYLEIDAPLSTGISKATIPGIFFDGQIIHNNANLDLQVYDVTGRKVASSTKNINLSNVPEGIYIVKGESNSMKIIL